MDILSQEPPTKQTLLLYVQSRRDEHLHEVEYAKAKGLKNIQRMHHAQANAYAYVLKHLQDYFGNDQSLQGNSKLSADKITCQNCNDRFVPKSTKAKFCSTKCRVSAHRKNASSVTNE